MWLRLLGGHHVRRSVHNELALETIVVAIAPQLIRHGNIDYLALDYLSEITMSLLTAAKQKNPVEFIYKMYTCAC